MLSSCSCLSLLLVASSCLVWSSLLQVVVGCCNWLYVLVGCFGCSVCFRLFQVGFGCLRKFLVAWVVLVVQLVLSCFLSLVVHVVLLNVVSFRLSCFG